MAHYFGILINLHQQVSRTKFKITHYAGTWSHVLCDYLFYFIFKGKLVIDLLVLRRKYSDICFVYNILKNNVVCLLLVKISFNVELFNSSWWRLPFCISRHAHKSQSNKRFLFIVLDLVFTILGRFIQIIKCW